MQALATNDIESELSYAYLHAVSAMVGAECKCTERHSDNRGVDAEITGWGDFPPSTLTEVCINVQLKATVKEPSFSNGHYSYFLQGRERYNALCSATVYIPRILVVLFLPKLQGDWMSHSVDELILRKCAYWVSLRGAPLSANKTGETVYLPEAQVFSPGELVKLMANVANAKFPIYQP